MKMKTNDVGFVFPVLGLTADRDVWGFQDLEGLTKCGPRTLRDNMQDRMELVDAEGRCWRVQSVRSLGRAGPILTRWVMTLLTGVPQFKIEHELEPLSPLTLQEVQRRVCEAMEVHREFWCDDDEADFPGRIAEVTGVPTISAIHKVLGLDTFESY
jgi:hypothetical protein